MHLLSSGDSPVIGLSTNTGKSPNRLTPHINRTITAALCQCPKSGKSPLLARCGLMQIGFTSFGNTIQDSTKTQTPETRLPGSASSSVSATTTSPRIRLPSAHEHYSPATSRRNELGPFLRDNEYDDFVVVPRASSGTMRYTDTYMQPVHLNGPRICTFADGNDEDNSFGWLDTSTAFILVRHILPFLFPLSQANADTR